MNIDLLSPTPLKFQKGLSKNWLAVALLVSLFYDIILRTQCIQICLQKCGPNRIIESGKGRGDPNTTFNLIKLGQLMPVSFKKLRMLMKLPISQTKHINFSCSIF